MRLKDPEHKATHKIEKPIGSSYDIICAADLIEPKKAYLELLDHPDIIIPYTPNDEKANKKSKPKFKSDITILKSKGINDQHNILIKKVKIGENINIYKLEEPGIKVSLLNNFTASAIACNKP